MKRILFRLDAGTSYGLGHLSRCYALTQQLLCRNTKIRFYINGDINISFVKKITNNQIEISILNNTIIPFEKEIKTEDIVIIDSYEISCNEEKKYQSLCKKLIIIDDFKDKKHFADAIINSSVFSSFTSNKIQKYFAGIEYALLRKEFLTLPQNKTERKGVLISMGGSDPLNLTIKIINLLLKKKLYRPIHVLCTDSFSADQTNFLKKLSVEKKIQTHFSLTTPEVVQIMDLCKYGIFSTSNVLLEGLKRNLICAFGYYTDNQNELYRTLLNHGAGVSLDNFEEIELALDKLFSIDMPNLKVSEKISSKLNEIIKYILYEN